MTDTIKHAFWGMAQEKNMMQPEEMATITKRDHNILLNALVSIRYGRFHNSLQIVEAGLWHEYSAQLQTIAFEALRAINYHDTNQNNPSGGHEGVGAAPENYDHDTSNPEAISHGQDEAALGEGNKMSKELQYKLEQTYLLPNGHGILFDNNDAEELYKLLKIIPPPKPEYGV